MYSKKSGNWYAVPIKTPKTYNYIIEMQMDAVRRRMADTELVTRRRKLMAEDRIYLKHKGLQAYQFNLLQR